MTDMADDRPDNEELFQRRISFGYFKAIFFRYGRLFAFVSGGVFLLGALWTFMQEPQYQATAKIAVKAPQHEPIPTEEVTITGMSDDSGAIDSQVELLYNPQLVERVVDDLGLEADPQFSESSDDIEITDLVLQKIKIYRSGNTDLINIMFSSNSPVKAAKIANSFAKNFLVLQTEAKGAETRRTNKLLSARIDEMAIAVRDAEQQVQQYKISNDLMSVNGATLAEQSIASIDNALARARADERAAAGDYSSASGAGPRLGVAQTPALENLLAEKAGIEQNLGQTQLQYGEKHPRHAAVRSKLVDLQNAIAQENARARAAVVAQHRQHLDKKRAVLAAATQKRVSLSQSLANSRRTLSHTNKAQVQLHALERKAAAVRTTYETYLTRYQETTTKLGAETPDARIVWLARTPTRPTTPNVPMNLILAGLLGVGLAFAFVTITHSKRLTG